MRDERIFFILWFIYIYYLIKYCRAGRYPPDQNSKNRYLPVIRVFKISVSVFVCIYAHGRAGRQAGRPNWSGGSGSTIFCPPLLRAFLMGLPKAKINSNIAHKPKKWLLMDELHARQNGFLLQLQAIYALHYSFAISFFYYFIFWNLTSSLFLFSFFYSAPWLSKPWEPFFALESTTK